MNKKLGLVVAGVLAAVGIGGYLYQSGPRATVTVAEARMGALVAQWSATGYVESRTAQLTAPQVGRIVEVLVREGDAVVPGQVLARLAAGGERAALDAQVESVRSAVAEADAARAALRETDRSQEDRIDRAAAEASAARSQARQFKRVQPDRLARADAELAAATARHSEAQESLASSRTVAQANLAAAKAQVDVSRSLLADVEAGARPQEIEQAEASVAAATAALTKATAERERQAALVKGRAVGRRELEVADEAAVQAGSTLKRARSALDLLRRGSRPDEIAAARARLRSSDEQVAAAQAQLTALTAQERKVEEAAAGIKIAAAAVAEVRASASESETLEHRARAAEAAAAEARAGRLHKATMTHQIRAAGARIAQGEAAVQQVLQSLTDRTVVAPFAGTVGRRLVDPGDVASPSQPLFSIVESSKCWIAAEVDIQDLGAVRNGQRLTLTTPAYPGRTFVGVVTDIGSEAIPQTEVRTGARIVRVQVSIAPNSAADRKLLRPGMDVDVSSRTPLASKALLVASDAILTDAAGAYVLVVEQGQIRRRKVRAGFSAGRETEILEGLQPGAAVVVSDKEGLADGMRVTVREGF